MAAHFTCIDRFGIRVVCDEVVWFGHILASRPELADCEQEVIHALTDPFAVYHDVRHPDRRLFYTVTTRAPTPLGLGYMRVVVQYRSGGNRVRGHVVTAFPTQGIRQGDKPV